ncbi:Ger(x)C family spore germination protein [Sulfoacidibacillus thermotolerans]|uniref:Uncharacterized protein n=1 Tax=Sulfoacidibacillus thermotolerans TaxID=1765684 RepID=A0A2U3D886_SULT2|nr:Ger(x)C family spore germination protein [Sulfoacidibacillus thermotolerans]PWI57490.1 hypothetical protein BM613_08435 [Sulfoacidibacillus thermotolerans]
MKIHSLLLIALSLLLSLPLTGCWSSLELRDAAIVSGLGIEKVKRQTYRLTVEVISGKNTQGSASANKSNRILFTKSGHTVLSIERNMIRDVKRRLIFTHAKSLVISDQVAKEDLFWLLDTWVRDQQPRLIAYLFVTPDSVEEVLEQSSANQTSASAEFPLSTGAENIRFISNYTTPTILEFLKNLFEPTNTAYLPMLRIKSAQSGQIVEYSGTAVINHDHMVGELNTKQTQGLVWLINKEMGGAIDTFSPVTHRRQALEVTGEKTDMHTLFAHNRLLVHFAVHLKGTVAEDATGQDMDQPAANREMEQAIAKQAQDILCDTVRTLQHQKTDLLGVGLHIYRTHPKLWHKLQSHWDEAFAHAKITTRVDVVIQHPGLIRSIYPHLPLSVPSISLPK